MTAKVLGIANQKGGVGKTTTALSLSAALAQRNKKVLVIDLDPHCCASVHLRYYPGTVDATIYDFFNLDVEQLSAPDKYELIWQKAIKTPEGLGFDFCASTVQLSDLDGDLRNSQGKGNILNDVLMPIKDNYDFIILDCPPHLGILLVNAIIASDLLIVPIQTDFLAVHGLKLLVDTVKMLNKALPEPLDFRALPTMYDKRSKACGKVLELLHNKMGDRVLKTIIGMDAKFREASAMGTVINQLAPSSRGAKAYEALAEEISVIW